MNTETEAKTARINIRLTPTQKAQLIERANKVGMDLTSYIIAQSLK